ncbi:MAG: xanthine dehydrogenase family protein molybdopterin-binding subunit [Acidimicrobiales bacterium]
MGRARTGAHNRRLVAGAGAYVADLALDGMLHVAILRSPHAHARIRSVDAAPARRVPGVVDVITGTEVEERTRPIPEGWNTEEIGAKRVDWYALARYRVRYVGEAVAAVVATDRHTAGAALDRIVVDYEVLPAVTDAASAMAAGAPLVEPSWGDNVRITDRFRAGDIDGALTRGPRRLRGSVRSGRLTGVPIETRGMLASADSATGFLTFWESTQQPHVVRTFLAEALDVSETSIRVIQPDVGGAFGLKQPTSQEEVLLAYAARKLRRPVRWIEERAESLVLGGHARETACEYEVAFDERGRLLALRVAITADVGAPTSFNGWGMSFVTMLSIPTVYRVPAVEVALTSVVTNKCPWTPYRGFGKDVATFLMERIMDRIGRATGLAADEVRQRNFVQPEEFPCTRPSGAVLDSGDYPAAMRRLLKVIDWDKVERRRAEGRGRGTRVGLGVAYELTPEGVALPGSIMNNGYDGATVRVLPTGEVQVLTGVTSPGTGNETALAQIAADALGCRVESVHVVQGDTDACPWGLGNYSSRSVIIGGSAVRESALELRRKLTAVAAKMLGIDPTEVVVGDGHVAPPGNASAGVTFEAVVEQVYWHAFEANAGDVEPALEATRYFRIGNISHRGASPGEAETDARDNVYPTWPNAATAALAEVDPETGLIKLLGCWAVEDAGTLINPLLAEAVVHGGLGQGIGSALYEQVRYDDTGQPLTATLMDYTIPTAVEVPAMRIAHQATPSPFTPLGAKGVGESGMGGVLGAVCGAVEDAFPELELHLAELPLTPDRVWRALRAAGWRRDAQQPAAAVG